jgi:transposase
MTDAEWAFLEPRFPPRSGLGRPPKWSRRAIVNGVFYVLCSSLPWQTPGKICVRGDGGVMRGYLD